MLHLLPLLRAERRMVEGHPYITLVVAAQRMLRYAHSQIVEA
jgi:hypothetical protein